MNNPAPVDMYGPVDSKARDSPDDHIYHVLVEYYKDVEKTSVGVDDVVDEEVDDSGDSDETRTELSSGPYAIIKDDEIEWSRGVRLGPYALTDADRAERSRQSVKNLVHGDLMTGIDQAVLKYAKGPIDAKDGKSKAQVVYESNPSVAAAKKEFELTHQPLTLYIVAGVRTPIPPPPWNPDATWWKDHIVQAANTVTLDRKIETFLDKDEALVRGANMLENYLAQCKFESKNWDILPDSTEFPHKIAVGNVMAAGKLLPGIVVVEQQQFH
jgi:hypothetical protein